VIEIFHNNLIWSAGAYIFLTTCLVALVGFLFWRPLLYAAFGFFLFTFFFFRNPDRVCPALSDPTVLVCPSDGKVVDIQHDTTGTKLRGYAHKVSIFLSVFDVHVNWIVYPGVIKDIIYTPGAFELAFLPKSSELNEHNDIIIACDNGHTIMVRQIAGTIARRICWWIAPGEYVQAGQKFGMIRFGSRVEIFLPQDVSVDVGIGQRVYGGQTVLGRWYGDNIISSAHLK